MEKPTVCYHGENQCCTIKEMMLQSSAARRTQLRACQLTGTARRHGCVTAGQAALRPAQLGGSEKMRQALDLGLASSWRRGQKDWLDLVIWPEGKRSQSVAAAAPRLSKGQQHIRSSDCGTLGIMASIYFIPILLTPPEDFLGVHRSRQSSSQKLESKKISPIPQKLL